MTKDQSRFEEEIIATGRETLNRRTAVAVITGGALGVAAWQVADPVLARHGDGDGSYDDDDDHSGHGGDGHDDHSGHGGGGDDDDGDHHGLEGPVVDTTSVEIVDERYEPSRIRIKTGDTVTWRNRDDDDHTASSVGMETGTIHPGDSGEVTFLEPGEFIYHCNFHPEMTGSIEVIGESMATPESATPEASPVTDAPTEVSVKIVDFGFDPEEVTVSAGGTVTWTNTGTVPHSIFGAAIQSEVLDAGDTFTWTAGDPGALDYQCGIHPSMTGTVIVADSGE